MYGMTYTQEKIPWVFDKPFLISHSWFTIHSPGILLFRSLPLAPGAPCLLGGPVCPSRHQDQGDQTIPETKHHQEWSEASRMSNQLHLPFNTVSEWSTGRNLSKRYIFPCFRDAVETQNAWWYRLYCLLLNSLCTWYIVPSGGCKWQHTCSTLKKALLHTYRETLQSLEAWLSHPSLK